MPPGMAPIVTLRGSNYRCLEQILMVPKGLEPSKFDCFSVCNRFSKAISLFVVFIHYTDIFNLQRICNTTVIVKAWSDAVLCGTWRGSTLIRLDVQCFPNHHFPCPPKLSLKHSQVLLKYLPMLPYWVFPCSTENPRYIAPFTVRAHNMGLYKAPYENVPDSVA